MAATGWRRRFLGTERSPNLANLGQVDRSPGEDDRAGLLRLEDQNGFEYLIKLGATTAK
jgi:hypothetical protein